MLLDGQGADEVLAGYQPYFPPLQFDRLDHGELPRRADSSRSIWAAPPGQKSRVPDQASRFEPGMALSFFHLARLSHCSGGRLQHGRTSRGCPQRFAAVGFGG